MKHCPECQIPLDHKKHKIFHSWDCPEGHGRFYPKGELEQILKAISGLGDLDIGIWDDRGRYSVIEAPLISPDGNRPLWEIRDRDNQQIVIYGDPVTHGLWVHSGEEEKLLEYIELEANADSVSAYVALAAEEAVKIFDDEEPLRETAGHMVTALKLLGSRILRAMPHITF